MRINLKQLRLRSGQKKTMQEKLEGSPEWLKEMQTVLTDSLSVELQVEFTGKQWVVRGTLQASLQLTCSRCLKEFPYRLEGNFERIVVSTTDMKMRKPLEDDDVYLFAEEGWADFGQAIEETLVLNIPMVPLCREDCSGLCAVCGKNLNEETCHCRNDVIDPRLEKLKNLL